MILSLFTSEDTVFPPESVLLIGHRPVGIVQIGFAALNWDCLSAPVQAKFDHQNGGIHKQDLITGNAGPRNTERCNEIKYIFPHAYPHPAINDITKN
jgi:hypothetical protein